MEEKIAGANSLLDALLQQQELKNDAALAKRLRVAPPIISKIRHGRLHVTPTLILNIHETFQMPVAEIRQIGNVPRADNA